MSEPLKDPGWVRITGWLHDRRRLNRLRKTIEDWGGRRFYFQAQKKVVYKAAPIPTQRLGRFALVGEGGKAPAGGLPIFLRQGQAFGTGLHESTRLVLKALSALPDTALRGKKVFDIGSGSGVLGFAALKRGADRVWAIEKDGPSREDLKHNRSLNGWGPSRMAVLPSGFPSKKLKGIRAQLLLANILTEVHLKLMGSMAASTAAGGLMLLSGIHTPAEAALVKKAARAKGLRVLPGTRLKKWELVFLKKPRSRR